MYHYHTTLTRNWVVVLMNVLPVHIQYKSIKKVLHVEHFLYIRCVFELYCPLFIGQISPTIH